MEKRKVRELSLKKRGTLEKDYILKASDKIAETFVKNFGDRSSYLLYHSYGSEVDTHRLLDELYGFNKAVYLPKVNGKKMNIGLYEGVKSLSIGAYGIMEPLVCTEEQYIDIVVVPGTAFDKKLNRVGYGKGFYDRFLNSVNAGLTVGFAFECQLFETIDCEPHDVPADILITENNIYRRNS